MAIVQFELDAGRARSPEGFAIDRHSRLSTKPVGDLPCRYRTGYPVTLWPIRVADAKLIRPPFPRGMSPPRGRRGGPADPARMPGRSEVRRSGPRCPALLLEGGERDGRAALRAAVQPRARGRLPRSRRRRDPAADEPPAARVSRPGRLRSRGRPAPLSPPVVRRLSPAERVLRLPVQVPLRGHPAACGGLAGRAIRSNWKSSCSSTAVGPSWSRTSRPRRSGWAAPRRSTCSSRPPSRSR